MYSSSKRIVYMAMAFLAAALPILWISLGEHFSSLELELFAFMNCVAWGIVLIQLFQQQLTEQRLRKIALRAGIFTSSNKEQDLFSLVMTDVRRRERALSMPHLEKRIHSREELAGALEEIVSAAYELLKAESAELALSDPDSGTYHSSFIKGRPFQQSAQAMFSDSRVDEGAAFESNVIIQPIIFAGNILGTLRIGFAHDKYPDGSDRSLVTLLAAQAALALTNAQYTEQLLRLKSASEESLRAKTGFLANLSHELRAPLGIILNGSEVLLDGLCGELNAEQEETILMVKSNGDHLLELVNDVLDYAKIESGKLKPEMELFSVQELLSELVTIVRSSAEEKGHSLILRSQNEPLYIESDRRHFRQILINLLTNAIKYTLDGGEIELWCEHAAGNRIAIHVTDSGIGIAAEHHSKVFDAFERVEHSYALRQGGTGLGMPLTKRLVEQNNGRISFDSIPDKGSHFWVSFPRQQYSDFKNGAEISVVGRSKDQKINGQGRTILIVSAENARDESPVLQRYLTSHNFQVRIANTADEALTLGGKSRYDLCIFENSWSTEDLKTIIKDLQTAQKNFSDSEDAQVPVLLLTSRAFSFDVEEFLQAGVDRCLSKPVKLFQVGEIAIQLSEGGKLKSESPRDSRKKEAEPSLETKRLLGVDDILH